VWSSGSGRDGRRSQPPRRRGPRAASNHYIVRRHECTKRSVPGVGLRARRHGHRIGRSFAPPPEPAITWLDQGWTEDDQRRSWFPPQGSWLVPYDWFLHLEQAGSTTLFRDDAHLRFLTTEKAALNPDGLPIGFAKWSEEDSPFVAAVSIPKQDFDTDQQNGFCEGLSFSPWHALPAHRPNGALNRVRKAVYLEDACYRRSKTIAGGGKPYLAQAEPEGWCLDLSGATCAP